MKTDLLGQEKNFVKIKLDYEAAEFDKALKKTLSKLAQDINVKGFRKGHAPRRIIEMQLGKDYLLREAAEELVNASLSEIVSEYELDLIASPALNINEIKEGEPFVCELTFEVMPEVKLPDFGEVSVERVRTNVTDDMVKELVMQIRRSSAETYKVGTGEGEQDRGINPDDIVRVEVRSQVEGEENPSQPQLRNLDLGDPTLGLRPEIRDALVGHKVGDDVQVDFTAEDDYPQKDIAGKKIHYDMNVKEVTGRNLPDLKEEFFKKFFGEKTEVLTEDAFISWCRDNLTKNMNEQFDADAAGRALAEITKRAELEVPDTMVNREVAAMRERDEKEAKERYNTDLKTFMGGAEDPDWEKNYVDVLKLRAQATMRHALVSGAIAKENDIKVEKEDLANWAQNYAATYRIDPNFVLAQLAQNKEAMNGAVEDARQEKVLKFVLTKVNVQEVDKLSDPEPEPAPAEAAAENAGTN